MDPFTLALLGGVLMGGNRGASPSALRQSQDYNPVTAINTSGGAADLQGISNLLTSINSQNSYNAAVWRGDGTVSALDSPYTSNYTYLIIGGFILAGIFLWRK